MGKKNAALRASDVDNKQTVALRGVSILPERADGFRFAVSRQTKKQIYLCDLRASVVR